MNRTIFSIVRGDYITKFKIPKIAVNLIAITLTLSPIAFGFAVDTHRKSSITVSDLTKSSVANPDLAQASASFYCIPSMRSTWIMAEQKDKKVYIGVKNPMGYEYMPQMDGPLAAATLPFQRMQFEDLKELGGEFTMIWPEEKCRFDQNAKAIFCTGEAENTVGSIKPLSISTIKITEDHDGTVYSKNRFRLSFEKDGNFYFASLDFYTSTCQVSASSKKSKLAK